MGKIEKYFGGLGLKILKGFILEKNIEPGKIEHSRIKNILIVVRHQMGDMLCATPMIRSVRNFYPDADITLVTKQSTNFEEIYKNNDSPVNEIICYEHGFENFINLIKKLREKKINLAIVPSTVVFSATNHLIAYFSEAAIRAGVKSMDYEDNKVSYLLNVKSDYVWGPKKVHQIERNLDIIRQLNIIPLESAISLSVNEAQKEFARNFLHERFEDNDRMLIGFHPGAAKKANIWAPEKFAELASRLYEKFNCNIFISEGPNDTESVNKMDSLLREKYSLSNIIRHKGLLMNNLALINLTGLFITNDTGIMHLASGIKVPEIALFGPTNAYEWGPVGENKLSIQASKSLVDDIDIDIVYDTVLKLFYSIK